MEVQIETLVRPELIKQEPAKRCSDYDSECVDVKCHYSCWTGENTHLGMADGYCPFVSGMS